MTEFSYLRIRNTGSLDPSSFLFMSWNFFWKMERVEELNKAVHNSTPTTHSKHHQLCPREHSKLLGTGASRGLQFSLTPPRLKLILFNSAISYPNLQLTPAAQVHTGSLEDGFGPQLPHTLPCWRLACSGIWFKPKASRAVLCCRTGKRPLWPSSCPSWTHPATPKQQFQLQSPCHCLQLQEQAKGEQAVPDGLVAVSNSCCFSRIQIEAGNGEEWLCISCGNNRRISGWQMCFPVSRSSCK